MPRKERSAGFILFRLDESKRRLYLLLDYGRHWDYAKGHVEKNEDDLAAARRELLEETGIAQTEIIDGFEHDIEYFFKSSRHGLIQKQVKFFIAQTNQKEVVLSEEHVGYDYLPYEKALERLTFPSAKEVLKSAEDFLCKREL